MVEPVHDQRLRDRTPWLICAVSVVLTVVGLVFHIQNRSVPGAEQFFDPVMPGVALTFPVVGAFIASHRPRNPVGWLCCGAAVVSVAFVAEQYAVYTLITDPASLPAGKWAAWTGTWVWVPGYLALWTLLPLLFPDGCLPGRRWRLVLWALAGLIAVTTLFSALSPGNVGSPALANPVGVATVPDLAGATQAAAILGFGPLCLVALFFRYRRAEAPTRGALGWVVAGTGLALAVPLSATLWGTLSGVALPLGAYHLAGLAALAVGVPAAITVAIVRHRLYGLNVDLETVVNRMLVYGGLIAVGAALYLAIVSAAEALFSGEVGLGSSLVAVIGIVLVWRKLRKPLQGRVDRLLYRKRDYDYRVLTSLGQCVQSSVGPDAVLPALVTTIAAGLKLPHVAVTVGQDGATIAAAAYGGAGDASVAMPLVHQSEVVGRLTVTPRATDEPFDAADRRLLDDLAGQMGTVAYALCLTADLQRSRERLVTAREEERRRLRRDLHDGLQPALAGVSLGLDAVRNLLGLDGPVDDLLARLKSELQAAGADIRHLVYDLRPPALDELGLLGALRQQATRFNLDPDGFEVVVTAPADLAALPAAVEVAAYRIGQEALENVRKHAGARRCEVVLGVDDGRLQLEVVDDGGGLGPGRSAGVGLVAMRERASELGGTFSVEPSPGGGTCVRATLPVPR